MPYLAEEDKLRLNNTNEPRTSGDLNYLFMKKIEQFLVINGEKYSTFNEVIGALECCKLEIYSRQIRPYEDDKIRINGDVFQDCPTERNLAWAAGFFEGEGSFFANYYKERLDGKRLFRTHASLAQKDIGLLEQFKNIIGFGVICENSRCSAWKTTRIGEAEKLLQWFRPWLSKRRIEKAEKLILSEQQQEFNPLSLYCSKGHEYTNENTITYSDRKGRICRQCRNLYARSWRKKQPQGYWKRYL